MNTPELKPCPFCGSPAKLSDGMSHATCDCISKVSAPGWLHILHWNTRHNPTESALNAAREALKEANRKLGLASVKAALRLVNDAPCADVDPTEDMVENWHNANPPTQ